jgi:hypothetical protein
MPFQACYLSAMHGFRRLLMLHGKVTKALYGTIVFCLASDPYVLYQPLKTPEL